VTVDEGVAFLAQKIAREGVQLSSAPLRREFSMQGRWRIYFNRHGAEPLMWCVSPDEGGWEIAVRDVQIATIAEAVYRKKETADEDDGRPSAWFLCEGVLTVFLSGFATIGSA